MNRTSCRHLCFVLTTAVVLAAAWLGASSQPRPAAATDRFVQFVFTSDAHYGITRKAFRGGTDVPARLVNRALVSSINSLATGSFPGDGRLRANAPVGAIDFIAVGGDVCNRAEVVGGKAIESATTCWPKFLEDYQGGLTLTDSGGHKSALFVVPGNHDASNAIGFYKPMDPPTDASAMVGIFNLMVRPSVRLTTATFTYNRDRVQASRDIGGVHFVFLQIWPDARARAWMETDLSRVSAATPVIIVVHDPPDPDPRHFRNPNGQHDINATDMFENLVGDDLGAVEDTAAQGPAGQGTAGHGTAGYGTAGHGTAAADPLDERVALEQFLSAHPNVTAYFHGHSNSNEFYEWKGPHGTARLHVFRVDSPMKGAVSRDDETRLSFQVATIDTASHSMTVREVLWNAHPDRPSLTWGGSTTVALSPKYDADR